MDRGIAYHGLRNDFGLCSVTFDVGGTWYVYDMDCRDASTVDWLAKKSEWKALNLAKKRAWKVRRRNGVIDEKSMIDRVASGFMAMKARG